MEVDSLCVAVRDDACRAADLAARSVRVSCGNSLSSGIVDVVVVLGVGGVGVDKRVRSEGGGWERIYAERVDWRWVRAETGFWVSKR